MAQGDRPMGDMVYIPAGSFVMGTSEEEAQRLAGQYAVHPGLFLLEAPKRTVELKAFWIDRFPVTNAQYAAFCKATGRRPPSVPQDQAEHPIANVGWESADAYARWAGKRLPTAEEWEKAARGADGRLYPWGNEWDDEATRIHDPRSPRTEALATPVGCFPRGASPYGVLDLCGNVAEWTATAASPPDPVRKWAWYVVKGASAAQSQRYHFRSAAVALTAHQSRAHPWLGFRCARDAEGPPPAKTAPPITLPASPREASSESRLQAVFGALPAGPREDLYLKEPIRLEAGPTIRVPYFPDGSFGMSLPEQVGAAGLPFGWSMKHTRSPWRMADDKTRAEYEAAFEHTAHMRVTVVAVLDHVDFTIALKNLTDKPFTAVQSNTCFQGWRSPYFEDSEQARTFIFTDDGPTCALQMPGFSKGEPLHRGWGIAAPGQPAPRGGNLARLPLMLTVSNDRQWLIAQAYAEGVTVAGNSHYSCLHVRPKWSDIPPGEERSLTGKLYFLKGGPEVLLERWKKDFGR